jgi:hypothetical protein
MMTLRSGSALRKESVMMRGTKVPRGVRRKPAVVECAAVLKRPDPLGLLPSPLHRWGLRFSGASIIADRERLAQRLISGNYDSINGETFLDCPRF